MSGLLRALVSFALLVLVAPAFADDIVAPATRNVTPSDMTPGPTVEGPLIREAVPPRPPDPPRWRRYYLPATIDAATFVVNTLVIHIAGVAPPAADATCALADGTDWPCGRVALFSFRRFLHGRAVECLFPFVEGAADVTAPCRIARTDLALWLLQQGWVKPSDIATDDYRTASARARCLQLGIWRETARPDYCPPA